MKLVHTITNEAVQRGHAVTDLNGERWSVVGIYEATKLVHVARSIQGDLHEKTFRVSELQNVEWSKEE